MIKKLIFLSLIIGNVIILTNVQPVLAEEENIINLLDNVPSDEGVRAITEGTTGQMNPNYRVASASSLNWTFNEAVVIKEIHGNWGNNTNIYINLYDTNNRLVFSRFSSELNRMAYSGAINSMNRVNLRSFNLPSIKRLEVQNIAPTSSINVRKIEAHGIGVEPNTQEVNNLSITRTPTSIGLDWDNLPDGFRNSNIYINGEKEAELTDTSYTINDLTPSSSYEVRISTVDEREMESAGLIQNIWTRTITSPSVDYEVTHNSVTLTWDNPTYYESYTIQRDNEVLETDFQGQEYTITGLRPNSPFRIRVLTNYEGHTGEDNGFIINTRRAPPPEMGGIGEGRDEEGNFIYTWDQPIEGQVKVVVGGNEFRTVNASNQSITIPRNEMAYDIWGEPDIILIPISEDGTEGEATPPTENGGVGGIDVPIKGNDVLTSGFAILGFLAPLILLILVVYFTRHRLIPVVKTTLTPKKAR